MYVAYLNKKKKPGIGLFGQGVHRDTDLIAYL